jgi:hypothetical protein
VVFKHQPNRLHHLIGMTGAFPLRVRLQKLWQPGRLAP